METGLTSQQGRIKLPPIFELNVTRQFFRRAESMRLNETVGVVARSLRLNKAVVTGRDHGGWDKAVVAETGP